LGSHGQLNKNSPYEEALKVPLLVRLPGAAARAAEVNTLVSGIDLMPTLTSLCGLVPPAACIGQDLSSILVSGTNPNVDSIYVEGGMTKRRGKGRRAGSVEWRGVLTERYKLVVDLRDRVVYLGDRSNDPFEMQNLAERPEAEGLTRGLRADLDRWPQRTGDSFPNPTTAADGSATG
jgi:arylsulfatase A-like enzyme